MMRHELSLAGTWGFQIDPVGSLTVETLAPDREITVPMPWQAAFPELERYSGYAWYRKEIALTPDCLQGEILLQFGAVDYWCEVFVNGREAGGHEGGYTPFVIPIRHLAREGMNEIAVRVYDSAQTHMEIPRWPSYPVATTTTTPPFDASHIPHGKQEWYLNVGGIWQDVTVAFVSRTYLTQLHVTPDIHTGRAHVTCTLGGARLAGNSSIMIEVAGPDGGTWETHLPLVPGQDTVEGRVQVESPQLWDVDHPTLYTLTATVETEDWQDRMSQRFGFREIRTEGGRILLNGEPLFLLCALDQDFYPDTIYTVPDEAYLRDQFAKAKHLGLNMLRCHIKPPDPRYLDLADEMGLLVWAEIPSWRTFYPKGTYHPNELNLDPAIRERAYATLEGMIARDYNHPSLVIWTLVNEDWGTALPLSAADREWVGSLYRQCKQLDRTRLVVDNSACPHAWGPNIHVASDLDDFHVYANIPDGARQFENMIEQFAMRPLWTYSSMGDSTRSGQEPLVLSEFGNWGLPTLEGIRSPGGQDPGWFQIGPWWSPWDGEPGWPGGVEQRFHALGLDTIWPDYAAFARATQWHQFAAMKFEIEAMRRQPALAGYVITEFTDCYWESNGLLDFARHPKVYHDRFAEINAPDVIIPRIMHRYAFWDDEDLHITLHGAHYSAVDWLGATLYWAVDGQEVDDQVPVEALGRGAVDVLAKLDLTLPTVDATRPVQFTFMVRLADGTELARNRLDVFVLPASLRAPGYTEPVTTIIRNDISRESPFGATDAAFISTSPNLPDITPADSAELDVLPGPAKSPLAPRLRAAGYETTRHLPPPPGLAVSDFPTPALLTWVRAGGDLLFLSRGPSPFFWVQPRSGPYSGSWMTSFSWLRPEIHRRLAVVNPLSLPYMNVMPHGTILGLPVENPAYQRDFLAGMVSGWVNAPSVHTVQFRYGKGRVIMTTLAIEDALAWDPVAKALFHDLVEYLRSDACQPQLEANY